MVRLQWRLKTMLVLDLTDALFRGAILYISMAISLQVVKGIPRSWTCLNTRRQFRHNLEFRQKMPINSV